MAITFSGQSNNGSAINNGTTSVPVAYPTGITAGMLLILLTQGKYNPTEATTPSGWTKIGSSYSGGSGSSGIDTGVVIIAAYYKIADGTETGSLTVSIPGGNSRTGAIYSFTKDAAETWDVPISTGGSKNTASTSFQITGADNLNCVSGDFVLAAQCSNTDAFSHSSHTLSVPGCTTSTVITGNTFGTAQGQDHTFLRHGRSITGGSQTSAPVYTTTASGSVTDAPAGAGIFVRLRVIANTFIPRGTLMGAG